MDNQIENIRKLHHEKYLNYIKQTKQDSVLNELSNENTMIIKDSINKDSERLADLKKIIDNSQIIVENDKSNISVDESNISFDECINQHESKNIPEIYKFDIYITTNHTLEYAENNISDENISLHRFMHNLIHEASPRILFKYCFDIRKLYTIRNQNIELYNDVYFLQPNDHEKIIKHIKSIGEI